MKKRTTIYLEDNLHKEAKKRIIDLDIPFSEYVAKLVRLELKQKFINIRTGKQ